MDEVENISRILCDRHIPWRLEEKFYSTIVMPTMFYILECQVIKKIQANKLSVAVIRLIQSMCGRTRKDRLRTEYVRGAVGVVQIRKQSHVKLIEIMWICIMKI